MKNYSNWMTSSDNSEEIIFDASGKSLIKINNAADEFESIINDANEWQKDVDVIWLIKKSLFTPVCGDFIEFQGNFYLNVFIPEERENYWSSKARLCNSTYPILTKTKTIKTDAQGKPILDKFGDPVYTFSEASVSIPCVVKNTFTNVDENKQLPLPQGQLNVTLPYRTDIKVNDTFSMYNNKYKIRNIDFTKVINEKGILTLLVEQVVN